MMIWQESHGSIEPLGKLKGFEPWLKKIRFTKIEGGTRDVHPPAHR
jgi:hypothetical protein